MLVLTQLRVKEKEQISVCQNSKLKNRLEINGNEKTKSKFLDIKVNL